MRKQVIIFNLILFVSLFFAACSDDDNKEKKEFNGVCKHEVTLVVTSNPSVNGESNIKTNYPTKRLDEILPFEIYDYKPPITKGELIPNQTSVKITGLKEGVSIKNLILIINGLTYRWNDPIKISGVDNTELVTSTTMPYFTNVFNKMIKQKGLTITMSYTSRSRNTRGYKA